jgi:hypothetical protein
VDSDHKQFPRYTKARKTPSCVRLVIAFSGTVFPLLRFFSGIEKAVYLLGQRSIEDSQGNERHIDKLMFAVSFHQLGHAAIEINVDNDE